MIHPKESEILSLHDRGFSANKISIITKSCKNNVKIILERNGRKIRTQYERVEFLREKVLSMFSEFPCCIKIENETGLCYPTIKKILNEAGIKTKRGKPFRTPPPSFSEVKELVLQGFSCREIGFHRKLSENAVQIILRDGGIENLPEFKKSNKINNNRYKEKRVRMGLIKISPGLISRWKKGARDRGIKWNVTNQELEEILEKQKEKCYYTGVEMFVSSIEARIRENSGDPKMISLDRKNSDLDYSKDNLVFCCASINYAKNDYGFDQFNEFIDSFSQKGFNRKAVENTEDSLYL